MAIINIDDDLYESIKSIIKVKRIDYPNAKNFADKAIRELLSKEEIP